MLNFDHIISKAQTLVNNAGVLDQNVCDFYLVEESLSHVKNKSPENTQYELYFSWYDSFIYYLECSVYCAIYHHEVKLGNKKADQKAETATKEFKNGVYKEYKPNKKSINIHTIYCVETAGE